MCKIQSKAELCSRERAVYDAHAGSDAAGFGFSATGFVTDHWLINVDAAVNRLLGSARESPITQKTVQHALGLSVAYAW
jgi:outer membrane scaffolding protein for murein synthesis (MipA/OmpV family)